MGNTVQRVLLLGCHAADVQFVTVCPSNATRVCNRGASAFINSSFEDTVEREIELLNSLNVTADMDYESFKEKVMSPL
jgi:hypothetical protein